MDTSSGHPQTPPQTPQYNRNKGKRPLERSDSPASRASSIHPTETTSPAKKAAKRAALADAEGFKVEELREGDVGYLTDADVVYPEELEEAGSSDNDGDNEGSSSEDDEDALSEAGGIARRMSRLHCGDDKAEANFSKVRRHRRLSKRFGSRQFKRSHSQSLKGSETEDSVNIEPEAVDVDAQDDQDATERRLRRRVRGPGDAEMVFGDVLTASSPEATGRGESRGLARRTPERELEYAKLVDMPATSDAMAVDND